MTDTLHYKIISYALHWDILHCLKNVEISDQHLAY